MLYHVITFRKRKHHALPCYNTRVKVKNKVKPSPNPKEKRPLVITNSYLVENVLKSFILLHQMKDRDLHFRLVWRKSPYYIFFMCLKKKFIAVKYEEKSKILALVSSRTSKVKRGSPERSRVLSLADEQGCIISKKDLHEPISSSSWLSGMRD